MPLVPDSGMPLLPVPYPLMDTIIITQALEFTPFLRLSYYRYFARPLILVLYAVVALNVSLFALNDSMGSGLGPGLFMVFVFILLPLVVYLNARTAFQTSHSLRQEQTYTISPDTLEVESELSYTRLSWELVYMVQEYKDWMVIFTSRYSAFYLYKPAFEDLSQWDILKSIIRSKPDIRQKLRKD